METTRDHDLLIRLDQKVDNLTEKVETLTDDHEKRIRSLEEIRDQNKGVVTGVSKLTMIVWNVITVIGLFLLDHFIFKK